jgi:hypothetical protein
MRQYPHRRIIPMAAADAVQFIVLTYATLHVPPMMTVLFLYAAVPSSLFMSRYLFPSRYAHYYSPASENTTTTTTNTNTTTTATTTTTTTNIGYKYLVCVFRYQFHGFCHVFL